MPFANRSEAGHRLATQLHRYRNQPNSLVLGLPRGGVPVAFEMARILNVPLDVFVVRKLGVPGHQELAMGAVATGGVRVLNSQVIETYGIDESIIESVASREHEEVVRRERLYRGSRPNLSIKDKTAILVDDGMATGFSMRAAVQAARQHHPREVIVAVGVASLQARDEIRMEADEVFCAETPAPFLAVGTWYEDFPQVSDSEVQELLEKACESSTVA